MAHLGAQSWPRPSSLRRSTTSSVSCRRTLTSSIVRAEQDSWRLASPVVACRWSQLTPAKRWFVELQSWLRNSAHLSRHCGRTGKSCPTISRTAPSTWCSALATRCTMPKARRGRVAALESMSRLLRPGGRLVLTSRTWELVRARGSRLDISDRLVRRNGRNAVVVYRWEIASQWEEEHHIDIRDRAS